MRALFGLLGIMFLSGVAGCGEREQIVEPQSEKRYQGKVDSKPWNSAPPVAELRGGTWTKGDQASWEEQIKRRQLAQNERNPR